jgi:hypothetical protein
VNLSPTAPGDRRRDATPAGDGLLAERRSAAGDRAVRDHARRRRVSSGQDGRGEGDGGAWGVPHVKERPDGARVRDAQVSTTLAGNGQTGHGRVNECPVSGGEGGRRGRGRQQDQRIKTRA